MTSSRDSLSRNRLPFSVKDSVSDRSAAASVSPSKRAAYVSGSRHSSFLVSASYRPFSTMSGAAFSASEWMSTS